MDLKVKQQTDMWLNEFSHRRFFVVAKKKNVSELTLKSCSFEKEKKKREISMIQPLFVVYVSIKIEPLFGI